MSTPSIDYICGFYTAMKGIQYLAAEPGATVEDIVREIEETIEAFREDGDLDSPEIKQIDEMMKAAEIARALGMENLFMEELEKSIG